MRLESCCTHFCVGVFVCVTSGSLPRASLQTKTHSAPSPPQSHHTPVPSTQGTRIHLDKAGTHPMEQIHTCSHTHMHTHIQSINLSERLIIPLIYEQRYKSPIT